MSNKSSKQTQNAQPKKAGNRRRRNQKQGGPNRPSIPPASTFNKIIALEAKLANASNKVNKMESKMLAVAGGQNRPNRLHPNRASTGNFVQDYLKCILDPKQFISRIPDSYPRPTACFRTLAEYDIYTSFDDKVQGRWSICAQPKVGDISDPTHYQLSIVDPDKVIAGAGWKYMDWASSDPYTTFDTQGADPRVDLNAAILTAPPPSMYATSYTFAPGSSNVLVNATPFIGSSTTPPLIETTDVGDIELPYGDWAMNVYAVGIPAIGTATRLAIFSNDTIPKAAVRDSVVGVNYGAPVTNGVSVSLSAYFIFRSRPNQNRVHFFVSDFDIPVKVPYNSFPVTSSGLRITPTRDGDSTPYLSGGAMCQVRPVAMSVLISNILPPINAGGEIAINYVPGDQVKVNYFANNSANIGQLQFNESVRKTDQNYNGNHERGAYAIWVPEAADDTNLVTPEAMNAYQYPAIVASGTVAPGTNNPVGTFKCARLEVAICYEFETRITAFDTATCIGRQSFIDDTYTVLRGQPLCHENPTHKNWISSLITKGWRFYSQNAGVINPMIMGAAALL